MSEVQQHYHQIKQKTFNVSSNIMFRELEGEAVLLNLNDESYYSLNESGTVLWNALSESPNLEMAYQQFKDHFKLKDEKAETDFNKLVDELIHKQFGTIESTASK